MQHHSRLIFVVFFAILVSAMFLVTPKTVRSQSTPGTFDIVVFRDRDSLTIYVPSTTPVSLRGVQFEVTDNQGKRSAYLIEQYQGFTGLNFDQLPGPLCLRLVRQYSTAIPPVECQDLPADHRFTTTLSDSNIFWYDEDNNQGYILTITRSATPLNVCPAQLARCPIVVSGPAQSSVEVSPTITAIAVNVAPTTNPNPTLTFISNRDGGWDIYSVDSSGSNIQRLTKDGSYKEQLTWSPDGKQVAFNSNREGNWQIYVLDMDTGQQRNITNHSGVTYQPSWSPDGNLIAFSSDRNGALEIYTMDPNGNNVVQLTSTSAGNIMPAWSRDGKQIAFTSFRDNQKERIYVMNSDGSSQHTVSKGTDNFAPTWSPDGKQIAFTAGSDTKAAVWLINADGTGLHNLTFNPGFSGYPTWSADGKYVAFSNLVGNVGQIEIIGPDKSNQQNLTNDTSVNAYPAWRP